MGHEAAAKKLVAGLCEGYPEDVPTIVTLLEATDLAAREQERQELDGKLAELQGAYEFAAKISSRPDSIVHRHVCPETPITTLSLHGLLLPPEPPCPFLPPPSAHLPPLP